ncbi:hypothetical protein [Sorangium sp. So ce117]
MAKPRKDPPSSEITPEALHRGRPAFLKNAGLVLGTSAAPRGDLTAPGR